MDSKQLLLYVYDFEVALVLAVQVLDHVFELEVTHTADDVHHVFEAAQVYFFARDFHLRLELFKLGDDFFARGLQLRFHLRESLESELFIPLAQTLVSEFGHKQPSKVL